MTVALELGQFFGLPVAAVLCRKARLQIESARELRIAAGIQCHIV